MSLSEFTEEVKIPKLDAAGMQEKDPAGDLLYAYSLGMFVFKRPTLPEEVSIGVERAKLLKGYRSDQVEKETFLVADWMATLKFVIKEAPNKWSVETAKNTIELYQVWDAYRQGLEKVEVDAR